MVNKITAKKTDNEIKSLTAIGLMSGTSMDAIDLAVIKSNGGENISFGPSGSVAYTMAERGLLDNAMQKARTCDGPVPLTGVFAEAAGLVTQKHAYAVKTFLKEHELKARDIDLLGFHGQTILHRPEEKYTCQIGDGRALARLTGIDVIGDFRLADMQAGGQGAPLAPLYHEALCTKLLGEDNVAILNLGGVGNVTFINDKNILAFDTGPGNALLDDWMMLKTGQPLDEQGATARKGVINDALLSVWMSHPYFDKAAPKSLDRQGFTTAGLEDLSVEDGAATLTALTVNSILKAEGLLETPPITWIICGGARHNDFMMNYLSRVLKGKVVTAEAAGWPGDELEAQAFAWLAIRSRYGLPLTLPETTGCNQPTGGGVYYSS